MKMKSTIINLWQTASQRLLFCVLASCFCALPAAAQSEDDDEEEVETAAKQPVRKAVKENYPLVTLHGVVTDQATGQSLAGIQLQALGHIRYTAMTEADGRFAILTLCRDRQYTDAGCHHAEQQSLTGCLPKVKYGALHLHLFLASNSSNSTGRSRIAAIRTSRL